jgi:hypothetical protein
VRGGFATWSAGRLTRWGVAISFLATISMLQSAIQIAGDGGARLKLDLDDTQMDAIIALSGMRGELLRVTVALEAETSKKQDDEQSHRQGRNKGRRAITQSEGAATE